MFNFFWNAIVFNFMSHGEPFSLEASISIGVHIGIACLLGLSGKLSRDLKKEMEIRKQTEAKLINYQNELEQRVEARTQELSKTNEKLRHAEKMQAIGQLAGGVAHDFNNMLAVILGYTELILEDTSPGQPNYIELKEIQNAALHSSEITRKLLAFARKQTIAPKILDLNKTVEGMIRMLQRLIGESIDLSWLPGKDPAMIKIDPSQIDQILANLCVNARDAVTGSGKIIIATDTVSFDEEFCRHHKDYAPGDYILLSVSDNGSGIDDHALNHLYEPFFTTKQVEQGTGLGLATVYGIVQQNNGIIDVQSILGKGTTFSIYFPRCSNSADVVPNPEKKILAEPNQETILLVEDEQAILRMIKIMLERIGYNVLATAKPTEALRLVEQYPGEIHLLITDVVMPDINGRELAAQLLTMRPDLKLLYISGYPENIIAKHGMLNEDVILVQKPFSIEKLDISLRKSLGR